MFIMTVMVDTILEQMTVFFLATHDRKKMMWLIKEHDGVNEGTWTRWVDTSIGNRTALQEDNAGGYMAHGRTHSKTFLPVNKRVMLVIQQRTDVQMYICTNTKVHFPGASTVGCLGSSRLRTTT